MSDHRHFKTAAAFRRWLMKHHDRESELWVAYYKKGTGKPSLTWPESVDQALCFGWIDGIRKRVDDESYKVRFTPRKPESRWSAINIKKMAALEKAGLLTPAGVAAFDKESVARSQAETRARDAARLSPDFVARIRRNKKAWAFWQRLTPAVRKTTTQWVMGAKKPETRLRRLGVLIDSAAAGLTIPGLR